MEKIIASKSVYTGPIFTVETATVALTDGRTATRDIVRHHGAAAVLLTDSTGRALFVRQWRTPLNQATLELPAGRIEPGESPLATIQRELNEEAGLTASDWRELTHFYQAAGFSDATMTIFAAHNPEAVALKRPQDVGEAVTAVWLTREEATREQQAGVICDSKTVLALALWSKGAAHA